MDQASLDTVRIRLYYDFASTFCYVSHRILTQVASEIEALGVELEWRPMDLTQAVPWDRGDSFVDEVRDAVRATSKEVGIDVEMPDPWLDSRPASEVALTIDSPPKEAQWRDAVFRSIFERGHHQLTPELVRLAQQLTSSDSGYSELETFELVDSCTKEALALGVTGVPTMLLDNWMFGGVYDPETMVSLFAKVAEEYRSIGATQVN